MAKLNSLYFLGYSRSISKKTQTQVLDNLDKILKFNCVPQVTNAEVFE